ncbi:MAG TPA: NrfD/PsrC family molybdoenzyme membrane anchor subunit [Gaiellaceae bacterium]|nr:NrfD/PsrC family molybdoenzyme membrane anchor subunit [Gaiellaceae bacterium]
MSHDGSSYYGRPILKEPVWKPEVPCYFFTGGLAGASSVLSLAARLTGNERLAKTSLYVGLAAEVASPALLISDLGRPERFLNMLRVLKPTSPMSVGSWVLVASGGATTTAAACELLGVAPRLKAAAELASAVAGAPLAVYTATLVSNTAVPVWHEGRRELPFVFAAASAASAGAAATLLLSPRDAAPARRLAAAGALVAEAVAAGMRRRLGLVGEVYDRGPAARFDRLAKTASLSGAVLLARGREQRVAAVAGAALVLGGGLARRFSVFRAGFQSARDPRYTVEPQRARLEAASAG